MERRIFFTTDMIGRVVEFGATHPEFFPKDSLGAQTFEGLGTALSKLSGHAIAQLSEENAVRINAKARAEARELYPPLHLPHDDHSRGLDEFNPRL